MRRAREASEVVGACRGLPGTAGCLALGPRALRASARNALRVQGGEAHFISMLHRLIYAYKAHPTETTRT